jgi:hypothetical protein
VTRIAALREEFARAMKSREPGRYRRLMELVRFYEEEEGLSVPSCLEQGAEQPRNDRLFAEPADCCSYPSARQEATFFDTVVSPRFVRLFHPANWSGWLPKFYDFQSSNG